MNFWGADFFPFETSITLPGHLNQDPEIYFSLSYISITKLPIPDHKGITERDTNNL